MRSWDILSLGLILTTGVWGIPKPFTPYEMPHYGEVAPAGAKLALKRSAEPQVHQEIARVQAVNRAYKKFAKRLESPSKRDAYAEVLAKHNEIIKRGENPGAGHLRKRQSGAKPSIDTANTPTISPAVALDEDGQDITYFSSIGIGSKNKAFFVVMDTGSSDLWVPGANCKSQACVVHTTLGSQDSSTLQATTKPWQIQYGSGSAAGVIVADSVSVGSLTVPRMPFGAVTQLSNNFASFAPDGIMGLAFQKANAQGVATIMDQLKSTGLISRKLIGVNLQRASDNTNDGEISFGVVDTGKFQGSLTLVDNVAQTGLWEVPMDDVVVNGISLGFSGKTSITDTGTTLMIIPPADANVLHDAIPGSVTDGQGNYAFPCQTQAEVALVFGGKSFVISPKDYVGAPLTSPSGLCQSNIVGQQIGTPDQWLNGDVFLKNVYSVFDFDNNQIGFASKTGTNGSSGTQLDSQTLVASSDGGKAVFMSTKRAVLYGLGSLLLSMTMLF